MHVASGKFRKIQYRAIFVIIIPLNFDRKNVCAMVESFFSFLCRIARLQIHTMLLLVGSFNYEISRDIITHAVFLHAGFLISHGYRIE